MTYSNDRAPIRLWLFIASFMIFAMVAVGGLTRLTRSGLSIVEWKPIAGTLPPLNDEEWQEAFTKYQQFPEYQKVNQSMTLSDFKGIFYWEYAHRLLGRLIGLVFILPLLFFVLKRQLDAQMARKLFLAFVLGGAQGALGWFMVKSGLIDRPSVSHFRLAAHLLLALFLMCFLFWLALGIRVSRQEPSASHPLHVWLKAFLGLLVLQIFYGALTAGLHAGHMYNTFPSMNGQWIPQGIGSMGTWLDYLENPVTVQFIHRILGALLLFSGGALAYNMVSCQTLSRRQRLSLIALMIMVCLQFLLGVLTLLGRVPVALGSLHQMGACFLLLLTVNAVHAFGRSHDLSLKPAG